MGSSSGSDSSGSSNSAVSNNQTDPGDLGSEAANNAATNSADSGGSVGDSSYDYEGAAYGTPDSISVGTQNTGTDADDGITTYDNQIDNTVNSSFDYEEAAYGVPTFDYEASAYGTGTVTNATYNKDTKSVDIEQTPGVITGSTYTDKTTNAFLDSPDVSDKDKIGFLNDLQAIQNSTLTGTKLSNVDDEASRYALGLISNSLTNVKENPNYENLTSQIDEKGSTYGYDLANNPIKTFAKTGFSLTGTLFKSGLDQYNNNKSLSLFGFDGKPMAKQGYSDGFDPYYQNLNQVSNEGSDPANNISAPDYSNIFNSEVPNFYLNNNQNINDRFNAAKNKISNTLYGATDFGAVYNSNPDNIFKSYLEPLGLNKAPIGLFDSSNQENIYTNYLTEQGLI